MTWWMHYQSMLRNCIVCHSPSTHFITLYMVEGKPTYGYCDAHAAICRSRFFAGETSWARMIMWLENS